MPNIVRIVRSLPPGKINQILDADVWRAPAPGADAVFDAERFGVWLRALADTGAGTTAQKLIGLDQQLVIAGLSRHIVVYDHAAVSSYVTLDGELAGGHEPDGDARADVGGFLVTARLTSAWDAILDLLAELAETQPEYFHRLMRECVTRSNGAREADGFHHLLEDAEQAMFDLASTREARRDEQGYVTPADARAFLEAARHMPLGDRASSEPALAQTRTRGFELFRAHLESHPASEGELALLANTLISGCSIQGRPFAVREARDGVVAICNLGFEHWPAAAADRTLLAAFQFGFSVLHQRVCMRTAQRLLEVVGVTECRDRDIQFDLRKLQRELTRATAEGTPWTARHALEVLMMLDAPSWAGLAALLDQCPVMHGAVSASRGQRHTIDAVDFEFISTGGQLLLIDHFLRVLPSAWDG